MIRPSEYDKIKEKHGVDLLDLTPVPFVETDPKTGEIKQMGIMAKGQFDYAIKVDKRNLEIKKNDALHKMRKKFKLP